MDHRYARRLRTLAARARRWRSDSAPARGVASKASCAVARSTCRRRLPPRHMRDAVPPRADLRNSICAPPAIVNYASTRQDCGIREPRGRSQGPAPSRSFSKRADMNDTLGTEIVVFDDPSPHVAAHSRSACLRERDRDGQRCTRARRASASKAAGALATQASTLSPSARWVGVRPLLRAPPVLAFLVDPKLLEPNLAPMCAQ